MDIINLKITNFLAIGDAPILSLKDRGLCLIQGVNEDDTSATSNGVGKSSIADALCWALYGQTARDESGDAVVNKVAKKNCSVAVVLHDGDTEYRIVRHRKHSVVKNMTTVSARSLTTGLGMDISKGTEKETQEVINGIMGCSLDVFMGAIYAGQEVAPDLPKMTDKQLKLLIEEAAGVERLEVAYEIARKKMGTAKDNLTIAQAGHEGTKRNLEAALVDHAKKALDAELFDKGREERAAVLKANANVHKELLVRHLTAMKGIDHTALTERSAALASTLAGHSALVAKRESWVKLKQAAQRNLDRALMTADSIAVNAKKLKGILENAETELKQPCPSCGRPGEAHGLEDYKAHLTLKLKAEIAELKAARIPIGEFQDEVNRVQIAIEEAVLAIPDVSEISTEQAAIAPKLTEYASLKLDASKEKAQMDRQNELAAAAMTETNPHASAIVMLAERVASLEASLAASEKLVLLNESALQVAENVAKVFSPAGVRAHILDTVTPFLNARTSDYLSALSDGNINAVWTTLATTTKGDLREKFCIEVSNDKGAESFKGLSGGEKRKVRLSTMLALQDLVASRATKPIRLWVGDEIDDALDSAGLERLMGILERKSRERGTVLVISHNSLTDWCDNVATVTKRDGLSTIDGALCP